MSIHPETAAALQPAIVTPPANPLFPVFLKLEELQTLVVGGGAVGLEKLNAILKNSPLATVMLVAPDIHPEIYTLADLYPNLTLHQRDFLEEDLADKDIVLVATDDGVLNRAIKDLAKSRKILANVADTPEQCDFYLGSIVQKGSLKLAISTNGKSPTVAKRIKEVLNEALPDEMEQVLDKLTQIRGRLTGDFAAKVKRLNEITDVLVSPAPKKVARYNPRLVLVLLAAALALMVAGHVLFSYMPLVDFARLVAGQLNAGILIYVLAGFVAALIDGALGMAYGVSATTFLLSLGLTPLVASASVHASEIFTSGASGLMHRKLGNVNGKLLRTLVLPGMCGAVCGAILLYNLGEFLHLVKPFVACYTLVLGVLIIRKTLRKRTKKKPMKQVGALAGIGGFLDAIGGGGWGPIVTSTLIAKGRHPLYTIGSSNMAKFFVSFASSATFISLAGISHWQVILGLVLGGMISAPIGAMLSRKLPVKTTMLIVGCVVIAASLRLIIMAFLG